MPHFGSLRRRPPQKSTDNALWSSASSGYLGISECSPHPRILVTPAQLPPGVGSSWPPKSQNEVLKAQAVSCLCICLFRLPTWFCCLDTPPTPTT